VFKNQDPIAENIYFTVIFLLLVRIAVSSVEEGLDNSYRLHLSIANSIVLVPFSQSVQ